MTSKHHQRADKVVADFKEIIGESICAQIPDANFQDLTLLIRDAISDELLAAADLVEKVAMKIRRDTDINQLGL
jgi:hypothetical protein